MLNPRLSLILRIYARNVCNYWYLPPTFEKSKLKVTSNFCSCLTCSTARQYRRSIVFPILFSLASSFCGSTSSTSSTCVQVVLPKLIEPSLQVLQLPLSSTSSSKCPINEYINFGSHSQRLNRLICSQLELLGQTKFLMLT